MVSMKISSGEEGRKLGRYLEKVLPKAPRTFFFKALRQGKIKVDRKKPKDLQLVLNADSVIDLYLTDEQLNEFGYRSGENTRAKNSPQIDSHLYEGIPVIYEDDQILMVSKPEGILSQKSQAGDVSLTEIERQYLKDKGMVFEHTYIPSFVHRLDRNTEGLMIMAKTLAASQALSSMIKTHSLEKYYWAITEKTSSEWEQKKHIVNLYRKDRTNNKAEIRPYQEDQDMGEWEKVELITQKLKTLKNGYSLMEVQLLTGKSHQIRAQLSFHGAPLVGDGKYNRDADTFRQLLFARAVVFKDCPESLKYLEGKRIECPVPDRMRGYLENV